MRRVMIKGLLAHKLRLALTALSVVLGVAFVAGTFVLTDTLGATFDTLFSEVTGNTDAQIRSTLELTPQDPSAPTRGPVKESVLEAVRKVDGVAQAEGYVQGRAPIVGKDGKFVGNRWHPASGERPPGSGRCHRSSSKRAGLRRATTKSSSTPPPPRTRTSSSATRSASTPARPVPTRWSGSWASARPTTWPAPRSSCGTCPPPSACSTVSASSTRSPSRRRRASPGPTSWPGSSRPCPPASRRSPATWPPTRPQAT